MNLFSNKATPERSLWKQLFAIFWLKSMKNTSQRVPFSKDIGCVNFLLVLSQKGTTYSDKLFSQKTFVFCSKNQWKMPSTKAAGSKALNLLKATKATIQICLQNQMPWKIWKKFSGKYVSWRMYLIQSISLKAEINHRCFLKIFSSTPLSSNFSGHLLATASAINFSKDIAQSFYI